MPETSATAVSELLPPSTVVAEKTPACLTGHFRRWWTYQRERFPVFAHGLLIAAFSFSAVAYSALLRGETHVRWASALVAFANSFLAFLQLRLADEFKDFEEDARFRPYRPVPRGLVSLRELGVLGAITGAAQLGLALALEPRLVWPLLLTWAYLGLMSREFFAREWLKARPVTYLWTHMLIMPLVDFYATACDWLTVGVGTKLPPTGLGAFLAVSFFNGIVIEFGRKLRAPSDEEPGVPTYSALWGRPRAVGAWLGALGATAVAATLAAGHVGARGPVGTVLAVGLAFAVALAGRFLRRPDVPGFGKRFELLSGLWTLAIYLSLGPVPLAFWAFGLTH